MRKVQLTQLKFCSPAQPPCPMSSDAPCTVGSKSHGTKWRWDHACWHYIPRHYEPVHAPAAQVVPGRDHPRQDGQVRVTVYTVERPSSTSIRVTSGPVYVLANHTLYLNRIFSLLPNGVDSVNDFPTCVCLNDDGQVLDEGDCFPAAVGARFDDPHAYIEGYTAGSNEGGLIVLWERPAFPEDALASWSPPAPAEPRACASSVVEPGALYRTPRRVTRHEVAFLVRDMGFERPRGYPTPAPSHVAVVAVLTMNLMRENPVGLVLDCVTFHVPKGSSAYQLFQAVVPVPGLQYGVRACAGGDMDHPVIGEVLSLPDTHAAKPDDDDAPTPFCWTDLPSARDRQTYLFSPETHPSTCPHGFFLLEMRCPGAWFPIGSRPKASDLCRYQFPTCTLPLCPVPLDDSCPPDEL